MQRTIDDYDSMTKREIIKAKQEKAQMYGGYSIMTVIQADLCLFEQAGPEVQNGLFRTQDPV